MAIRRAVSLALSLPEVTAPRGVAQKGTLAGACATLWEDLGNDAERGRLGRGVALFGTGLVHVYACAASASQAVARLE